MKIIFLLFLIMASSVYAEDEETQPVEKKHKFILKTQFGFLGNYKIPEADENRKIANLDNALDLSSGIRSLSTDNTKNATGFVPNLGIEYRFLERFRIMFDRRTFSSSAKEFYHKSIQESNYISNGVYLQSKGRYDWNETVQKYGVAYYQPIFSFFSIGGLARRYDISQEYSIFRKTNENQRLYTTFIQQEKENSRSSINGIVPGIGLEFYFLKMFEIRYTHEFVNLNGVKSSRIFTNAGGIIFGINYEDSKFKYTGQIQNLDFGFKIPKIDWLTMRVGITEETLKRNFQTNYNGYIIFGSRSILSTSSPLGQYISSQVYSAFTDSEVRFRNVYFQFEMSHSL
jgi:hypothetical protein